MRHYVLYMLDDGRVLASGSSFSPDKLVQPGQGILFPEAPCDPCCCYIEDGQVIPMPQKPGGDFEFDYEAKAWVLNVERQWFQIRARRDSLLLATDWRLLRAAEGGAPLAKEWQAYRQALRDITAQPNPAAVVWPEAPHE